MIHKGFGAFLQRLPKYFRSPRQIIPQDAPLRVHLVPRKQAGNHGDADDKGQDHFQGRAHRCSSYCLFREWAAPGWGAGDLN